MKFFKSFSLVISSLLVTTNFSALAIESNESVQAKQDLISTPDSHSIKKQIESTLQAQLIKSSATKKNAIALLEKEVAMKFKDSQRVNLTQLAE